MKTIAFCEEAVLNPNYKGYIGGRLEIYSDDNYPIYECRFFTNKVSLFEEFRLKWDGEQVSNKQLKKIEKKLSNDFYHRI